MVWTLGFGGLGLLETRGVLGNSGGIWVLLQQLCKDVHCMV